MKDKRTYDKEFKLMAVELMNLGKTSTEVDKANCISIAGKEPIVIGWQRSGMGMFSYVIFDQNLIKDKR